MAEGAAEVPRLRVKTSNRQPDVVSPDVVVLVRMASRAKQVDVAFEVVGRLLQDKVVLVARDALAVARLVSTSSSPPSTRTGTARSLPRRWKKRCKHSSSSMKTRTAS